MKFIDIINGIIKSGMEGVPLLDAFLKGLAERFPDTAPQVEALLAQLDAAAPPDAEGLVGELKEVLSKGLNPRQHPSDLA